MDDDRYLRQVDFLRVMFIALLVLLLMLASGCAGIMEIKAKGAEVMDDAVAAAEITLCEGASVGAIRRRFNSPESAATWRRLCAERGSWGPEQ